MWNNAGAKIKFFAEIMFWLSTILTVIVGLAVMMQINDLLLIMAVWLAIAVIIFLNYMITLGVMFVAKLISKKEEHWVQEENAKNQSETT